MQVRASRPFVLAALLGSFFIFPGADTQGCQSQASSSVAQDRIHTGYWVYRESNTDVTFQRAQFRFGGPTGTSLELAAPASVAVADDPLAWGALLDWYERKVPGTPKETTFVYTDTSGKSLTIPTPPIREAQIPVDFPKVLPQSNAAELRWDGEPLIEGETMEVVIAQASNRFRFAVWYEKNVGARSTVLTKEGLASVPTGSVILSIRRHHDVPLPAGADTGGGGKMTTTYQPIDRNLTLE